MNILVTGGAGFVGHHLVKTLIDNNNSVTILDNFSKNPKEKISNLISMGAIVIEADIIDYDKILNLISPDIDLIIHLAAKTRVIDSIKNPAETNDVNVTGTINLLRVCVEKKIKKFIFASSGAVYGNTKKLPLQEEFPKNPLSPYGASKLAAEHYVQAFANSYDMNTISLRFSNIYGEGQSIDYAGVITKFAYNIQNNKPLTVFGDGKQTRDFVYVTDIANGINKAIQKINGKYGTSYNFATGKYTSIEKLAKIMLEISGKKLDIIFEAPRKGEIRQNYASIELAKKELDYLPQYDIRKGLEELLSLI